jgi:hypothetical protein
MMNLIYQYVSQKIVINYKNPLLNPHSLLVEPDIPSQIGEFFCTLHDVLRSYNWDMGHNLIIQLLFKLILWVIKYNSWEITGILRILYIYITLAASKIQPGTHSKLGEDGSPSHGFSVP